LNRQLLFSEKNNVNILAEEIPLLTNLKREEKHQNMIFLSEQATALSDILFKRHLQQLPSETLQVYLPKLNKIQKEKLLLHLNWLSYRKQSKLSKSLNFRK